MQELLIVNPARRPSKRRKSTKPASPAQKRARAAFAAMARARAGKKPRRAAKRKASPKSTSLTIMSNPKRRRRSVAKTAKRRRNPSARSLMSKPFAILTPALMGALGATVVNTALARLPIPAAMNTGKMKYVTQGAAAVLMSIIASKVGMKGAMANQMAEGALTVTLHQAITEVAGGFGMNLSGMGYYLPGRGVQSMPSQTARPAQLAGGMGEYVTGPGAARSTVAQFPTRSDRGGMRGFGFSR